jgi:hypothetical protein
VIRLATLFWLVLVSATGFAMFAVKYEVQALDDDFARTKKTIAAEEHEIHVLDAEWAYLTRPEILEEMNRRYLSLGPITTRQLHTTVDDIPLRPLPPAPAEVVAVAVARSALDESPPPALIPPPAPLEEPPPLPQLTKLAPAAALSATPEQSAPPPHLAKPVPVKVAAKRAAVRPPKSLDELFAQVSVSR